MFSLVARCPVRLEGCAPFLWNCTVTPRRNVWLGERWSYKGTVGIWRTGSVSEGDRGIKHKSKSSLSRRVNMSLLVCCIVFRERVLLCSPGWRCPLYPPVSTHWVTSPTYALWKPVIHLESWEFLLEKSSGIYIYKTTMHANGILLRLSSDTLIFI